MNKVEDGYLPWEYIASDFSSEEDSDQCVHSKTNYVVDLDWRPAGVLLDQKSLDEKPVRKTCKRNSKLTTSKTEGAVITSDKNNDPESLKLSNLLNSTVPKTKSEPAGSWNQNVSKTDAKLAVPRGRGRSKKVGITINSSKIERECVNMRLADVNTKSKNNKVSPTLKPVDDKSKDLSDTLGGGIARDDTCNKESSNIQVNDTHLVVKDTNLPMEAGLRSCERQNESNRNSFDINGTCLTPEKIKDVEVGSVVNSFNNIVPETKTELASDQREEKSEKPHTKTVGRKAGSKKRPLIIRIDASKISKEPEYNAVPFANFVLINKEQNPVDNHCAEALTISPSNMDKKRTRASSKGIPKATASSSASLNTNSFNALNNVNDDNWSPEEFVPSDCSSDEDYVPGMFDPKKKKSDIDLDWIAEEKTVRKRVGSKLNISQCDSDKNSNKGNKPEATGVSKSCFVELLGNKAASVKDGWTEANKRKLSNIDPSIKEKKSKDSHPTSTEISNTFMNKLLQNRTFGEIRDIPPRYSARHVFEKEKLNMKPSLVKKPNSEVSYGQSPKTSTMEGFDADLMTEPVHLNSYQTIQDEEDCVICYESEKVKTFFRSSKFSFPSDLFDERDLHCFNSSNQPQNQRSSADNISFEADANCIYCDTFSDLNIMAILAAADLCRNPSDYVEQALKHIQKDIGKHQCEGIEGNAKLKLAHKRMEVLINARDTLQKCGSFSNYIQNLTDI